MSSIRFQFIGLILWFIFLLILGLVVLKQVGFIDTSMTSYYVTLFVLTSMLLLFPEIGQQRFWLVGLFSVLIHVIVFRLTKDIDTVNDVLLLAGEAAAIVVTQWLVVEINRGLQNFNMLTENFLAGKTSTRIRTQMEGQELINHELYRAHRFARPMSLVYCELKANLPDPEISPAQQDFAERRIGQLLQRRYHQMRLMKAIETLIYKNDIVTESVGGFVICLPEASKPEGLTFINNLSKWVSSRNFGSLMAGLACFPDDGMISEDLIQVARTRAVEIDQVSSGNIDDTTLRTSDLQIDFQKRLELEQQAAWVNAYPYQSAEARERYNKIKRAIDLLVVLAVSPLILPVCLLIAALIYLDDKEKIFYMQPRTGYGGKRFEMYKFRTMYVNAPAIPPQEIVMPDGSIRYGWPEKVENDRRVTRIGRILRKTSLDELPQLLNILRGDMTLIGPRPTTWSLDKYTQHQTERLTVRPGLTGLWQVCARETTNFDERLLWDMKYIDHMNFWLDARILWMTFSSVVQKKGV
jgi:lipopolysaccharide/colanic/teichoic acid biosynthesis glycosyltransferase